jgi:hypothetical protein
MPLSTDEFATLLRQLATVRQAESVSGYTVLLNLALEAITLQGEFVQLGVEAQRELLDWWAGLDRELALAEPVFTDWPLAPMLSTLRKIAGEFVNLPRGEVVERGLTHVISRDPRAEGGKTITCLTCRRTSDNRNDVEHRYCGACHTFHEVREVRRRGAGGLFQGRGGET